MRKYIAFAGIVVDFEADSSMSEMDMARLAREQFMDKTLCVLDEYEVGVADIQLHPDEEAGER